MPQSIPAFPDPRFELTEEGACVRRLQVTVDVAEVEEAAGEAVRRLARSLRLPGFRHGKVPAALVRTRHAKEIEQEVVEHLASRHVSSFLEKRNLNPVAPPVMESHSLEAGKALTFTARFEIQPPFELGTYRDVSAERPSTVVNDEDVDKALESLRQSAATLQDVARPAAAGDHVLLDLHGEDMEGENAGQTFVSEDVSLEVGTEDVHPDLSGALVGLGAGEEKDVRVRYAGDYRTQALAGRNVHYRLKVKGVRQRQVPDLDDELARRAGEFKNVEELRKRVRQDLELESERRADEAVRRAVVGQLLERHPFEVPPALVESEARRRLQGLAQQLASQGVDPSQAGVPWEQEAERARQRAAQDIRAGRLLDAIADKESLEVKEEDLEAFFTSEGERRDMKPAVVRAAWEKEGRLGALRAHMRRDRVLDFLTSLGHIQEHGDKP